MKLPSEGNLTGFLFRKILPFQIALQLLPALNSFVDSLMAARLISPVALSVMSLCNPAIMVINAIAGIITSGSIILLGQSIGKANKKTSSQIFTTALLLELIMGIVISVFLIFFTDVTSVMLCGKVDTDVVAYLKGIGYGQLFVLTSQFFAGIMQLYGESKRIWLSIGIMILTNGIGNLLLCRFGTFGLGLATSISCLVQTGVMCTFFLTKKGKKSTQFGKISLGYVKQIIIFGSPVAVMSVTVAIKNYIFNLLLLDTAQVDFLAVLAVQNTFIGLLSGLSNGIGQTVSLLGSVAHGEGNRVFLHSIVKKGLILCIVLSLPITLILMLLSGTISGLYFGVGSKCADICSMVFLIFPSYLVFSCVNALLENLYQAQGKIKLSRVIIFVLQFTSIIVTVVLYKVFDATGFWFAQSVRTAVGTLIILIYVWIKNRKITFNVENLALITDNLSMNKERCLSGDYNSIEQAVSFSEKTSGFIKKLGGSQRLAYIISLSLEETMINVVEHGFPKKKNPYANVSVMFNDDCTKISFKDNCNFFDPLEWQHINCDFEKNRYFGVKLITALADDLQYQRYFDMNVLTLTVRNDKEERRKEWNRKNRSK